MVLVIEAQHFTITSKQASYESSVFMPRTQSLPARCFNNRHDPPKHAKNCRQIFACIRPIFASVVFCCLLKSKQNNNPWQCKGRRTQHSAFDLIVMSKRDENIHELFVQLPASEISMFTVPSYCWIVSARQLFSPLGLPITFLSSFLYFHQRPLFVSCFAKHVVVLQIASAHAVVVFPWNNVSDECRQQALVVSVRGMKIKKQPARTVHSHAACGFTKSIWQPRCAGCCQSISLHIPSKNKRHCDVTRFVSVTQTAAALLPVNEPWEGRMGGRAASQPQQSSSLHQHPAGTPCESPCARECRCLSRAGMGSATETYWAGMRQTTLGSANCPPGCSSDKDVEKSHGVWPANVIWTSQ